jgi:hypothetical protein
MVNYSKNNLIIYALISILRRITDSEYIEKVSKEFLFTFLALLDFYYVSVKETLKIELNNIKSTKLVKNDNNLYSLNLDLIILKEITALLGNLMIISENVRIVFDKSLHLVLVDNIISFIKYPKIVKICVGTLINLNTHENVRNSLGSVAAFIQCICLVLETYKNNSSIIDYLLKLILNSVKNSKFYI